jgi:2-octaprenyl-6-methoxyphenol hydroxylase
VVKQADRCYDIAIAGGGMVGASLACALASLPLRVALVESVPFSSTHQPSFDARSIALSRSSQRILDTLGIWAQVAAQAWPIRRIHVSEQGRFGTALIDAQEQGVGELGYVLESRVLGAALWAVLEQAKTVDVFCPASLESVVLDADDVHAPLTCGAFSGTLRARLLVIADGARSRLRDAIGIDASSRPYDQTAVVGNVEISARDPGHTAYERFTAQGPLALLPMGKNRFVFVLTRRTERVPEVLELADADFLELLQQSFGSRLGRFRRVGKRAAYPLALVQASRVTARRTAVVGNAAHGLHPVAGQGYNLGLRDIATLAEVVADTLRQTPGGADPGSDAVLNRYRDWRRRDQRSVVRFTDGLIRLFDLRSNSLGIARGLSLMMFDMLPGAKRSLAHHTMGLGGTLTRLARGLPL